MGGCQPDASTHAGCGTLFTISPANFDVYAVANVMAEARLELAGVVMEPANPTRVSLPPVTPLISHGNYTVTGR
jgi:hypothetical protein